MNRSRRGLFSAAARSTFGPLSSRQHQRQSQSAASSQSQSRSQRQLDSTRGRTKVRGQRGPPKKQQKQQHLSRIGNSVAMLLNDSVNNDLYMSRKPNSAISTGKAANTSLNTPSHALLPRSSSQRMTASRLYASNAGSSYNIFDDEAMFMSDYFSPMDLSSSCYTNAASHVLRP